MKFLMAILMFASFSAFAQGADFDTRIHDSLRISGRFCDGKICPKGQWLIDVNENFCEVVEDGAEICTKRATTMFLAKLVYANIISISTTSYYEIVPVLEVRDEIKELISNYLVRFDINGKTRVVSKK
jgi:hypothetical protein